MIGLGIAYLSFRGWLLYDDSKHDKSETAAYEFFSHQSVHTPHASTYFPLPGSTETSKVRPHLNEIRPPALLSKESDFIMAYGEPTFKGPSDLVPVEYRERFTVGNLELTIFVLAQRSPWHNRWKK